jgi:hypothetical protein
MRMEENKQYQTRAYSKIISLSTLSLRDFDSDSAWWVIEHKGQQKYSLQSLYDKELSCSEVTVDFRGKFMVIFRGNFENSDKPFEIALRCNLKPENFERGYLAVGRFETLESTRYVAVMDDDVESKHIKID